mmetsp:Transcript_19965/g.52118  ORF Transcript_19965/g.52118 Transcript_19965/m.52118 type:complete len:228 (-) Transcript_19965:150-833(-)
MRILAGAPPAVATYRCSSGRAASAATGTRTPAPRRRWVVTWTCCAGRGARVAPGTRTPVGAPPGAATWSCCSGPAAPDARGTVTPATRPPRRGTLRCCDGLMKQVAPGRGTPTRRRCAEAMRPRWSGCGARAAPCRCAPPGAAGGHLQHAAVIMCVPTRGCISHKRLHIPPQSPDQVLPLGAAPMRAMAGWGHGMGRRQPLCAARQATASGHSWTILPTGWGSSPAY